MPNPGKQPGGRPRNTLKIALMGASLLTGFAAAAHAQDAAPAGDDTVVIVTGYRASLQSATKAKKNATNFTESVFAEDMGKFPDLNMAEAMQRVPGMVVQRDALTGDGTQISVRALPASFTLVTMNGNRVAVASDFGFTGSSSPNRQVDLDMYPTELFNRVDVSKTPSADTMEGGIAGAVNLQNARPFDHKGTHVSMSLQGSYNTNARNFSPRYSLVASKTWDKFGILAGLVSSKKKVFSDGFETVGWTAPNLSNFCNGCDPGLSFVNGQPQNIGGSNGFKFSNTVYPYTGNGLTPGTVLSEADLLALYRGLTEDQLKGAMLPRLGRNYLLDGDSKQNIGVISMEYRPNDDLRFTLDIFGGKAERDALRTDMMWAVRSTGANDGYNNGMIPLNMQVDSNNVVTSGTFANSAFLAESNHYVDDTGIASFNAGMNWKINDKLTWDAELAYTHSTYERDVTFLKFLTPTATDITVTYNNAGGTDIPTINPNVNLNDPNLGWRTFQILLQRDKRYVDSKSAHTNLNFVLNDNWTLRGGLAYDSYVRSIDIHDNSTAYSNAFKAAIPDAQLGGYLLPMTVSHYMDGVSGTGYTSFIVPNFSKIEAATDYDSYLNADGTISTGNTYNGAGAGFIEEKISNAYAMAFNTSTLFGVPVKSNFGLRYQNTDQTVTSPSTVAGQIVYITTEHKYHDILPSFNAVANVTDKLNLRVAASKTMTRANPSQMTSQLNYSDPGGQNASAGNPALQPYYSNNFDIGGEYYTGGIGYVGLTFFTKTIRNFTTSVPSVTNFQYLVDNFGVTYDGLGSQQQTAIATQLGTSTAALLADPSLVNALPINFSQPVNSSDKLKLDGAEFMWVQPLDFVLNGLGYSLNYTHFTYNNRGLALGIPDYTYNLTAFYEKGPFSVHLSYADVSRTTIGLMPSANSEAYDWYGAERHQIDLSASYKFKLYGLDQSITLDAVNLDKQGYRNYYTMENVPYSYNNPGSTIYIGWRAQY